MSTIEKLQQNVYEMEFNDCCANIAGLHIGVGDNRGIYFKDDGLHGTYECKIEDYVPYTSLDQLEPVIEILKSTLGFTVDLETQRRDGVLVAYRSMVDDMLDAAIDCDNHPYEACAEREEAKEAEDTEDIKRKLVNSFCAKTMGWHRGTGCYEHEYFKDDGGLYGSYMGEVEDYNPYDDFNKMLPAIDALASGLNVFPNRITISNKGHLAAARELILDNIVSEEDKAALLGADELVCCTEIKADDTLTELREKAKESFDNTMAFGDACKNWSNIDDEWPYVDVPDSEEERRKAFNEKSRKIRGIAKDESDFCCLDPWNDMVTLAATVEAVIADSGRGLYVSEGYNGSVMHAMREYVDIVGNANEQIDNKEDILDGEESWDEYDRKMAAAVDVFHPMYDDDLQGALRESTKRQFEHSLRLNMPYGKNGTVSKEVIKGCVGRERFWEDEEIIMNDFTHVGNPRSIYWQAARILILAHHRGYDDMYVDMNGNYNIAVHGDNSRNEVVRFDENVEDGLLQAYKIEAYIRNPDNCMEGLWAYVSAENPYILPELDNVNLEHLHQHRLKIIKAILEKRMEGYKSAEDEFNELCQRITKTVMKTGYFIETSTFNPYQDLQQLSRIVEMVLGATGVPFVVAGYDGVDMMVEMRDHVETYSAEGYMKLEEL